MTDNKLVEDDKDKRFSSKFQAFIWWINHKEIAVGLLVDQDAVWVAVRDWSSARWWSSWFTWWYRCLLLGVPMVATWMMLVFAAWCAGVCCLDDAGVCFLGDADVCCLVSRCLLIGWCRCLLLGVQVFAAWVMQVFAAWVMPEQVLQVYCKSGCLMRRRLLVCAKGCRWGEERGSLGDFLN